MQYMHEYAAPFYSPGNKKGCLIIHGFTGTPAHMRFLGKALTDEGYTVSGILLKGHGTSLEDMEQTTWKDWWESSVEGYKELKEKCDEVYVMGLSMGGILSLLLAEEYDVDKVIPIAAPIRIYSKLAHFTPILKYFVRYDRWEPDNDKKENGKREEENYNIGYWGTPVGKTPDLLKLMKRAERNLQKIKSPALIIQSKMDETVKPISADIIYKGISSTKKEIVWLEKSKHVSTLGPEKDLLHQSIIDFLKN